MAETGITELRSKVTELNGQISDYKEKLSVIDKAISLIKSKKRQLIVAKGDLSAARTWIQNSVDSFKENYNGSDTAEKKLDEMKNLKRDLKMEFRSISEVYINSLDTCIEKLENLKSQYQTKLQNCQTKLSDAKEQISKYNKGSYVNY